MTTACTTLKIVVVAPMPRASDSTAVAVKAGLCASARAACRTSRQTVSSHVGVEHPERHKCTLRLLASQHGIARRS